MCNIAQHFQAVFILLSFVYGCYCSDDLTQDDMKKLCPAQGISFLSYPNDCGSFIFCNNNVARKESCSMSERPCFDQYSSICEDAATCSCTIQRNLLKMYCQSKPDSTFLKVPAEDCSMFYVCMGAEMDPISEYCPNGLHYSRAERDCVTPLNAGCQTLSRMCQGKYNGFRFPAIDCMEYYECNNEEENLKVCPFGQYYDGETSKCIATSANSECKNEDENDNDNEEPTTTTSTTTVLPTTVLPTPGPPPPICTIENQGQTYPHEDCYKYYICFREIPMVIYCPDGYSFNAAIGVCQEDIDNLCILSTK